MVVSSNGELSLYRKNTADPWSDTPFSGYAFMSQARGELAKCSQAAEQGGHKVEKAHSSTQDMTVNNDMKVEINLVGLSFKNLPST